jgi:heat shock protein HslJ
MTKKIGDIMKVILLTYLLFIFGSSFIFGSAEKQGKENNNNPQLTSTEIFEIAEHQVYCEQIVPRKCLYIKRKGDNTFKPLWDEIENFKYIDGYRYKLKVEVEKINQPAKDTSGFKYYLKEIISREKIVQKNNLAHLYLSKWFLKSIDGNSIKNGKPFIVFNKDEGTFYGNTGCNSIGGSYKIENENLKVFNLRQSKRACPDMREVESPFIKYLTNGYIIKVEVDRLYLINNGMVILDFQSNWAE